MACGSCTGCWPPQTHLQRDERGVEMWRRNETRTNPSSATMVSHAHYVTRTDAKPWRNTPLATATLNVPFKAEERRDRSMETSGPANSALQIERGKPVMYRDTVDDVHAQRTHHNEYLRVSVPYPPILDAWPFKIVSRGLRHKQSRLPIFIHTAKQTQLPP